LQLQEQSGPLANSAVDLAYDALGRVASRTVTGAGAETFGYDMIGRLVSDSNDLGPFALSYLGQTGQITGRQLVDSTLGTSWSYLPNAQDRRLAGIDNVGLSSGQYSNYAFTTTPYFITNIAETSDQASAYPTTLAQTASYNNLNQLTDLSGQALSFDANGNLLSDGQRDYTWDAENRLTGITYPGQPGKQTTFAYNGLGQRVAIASTPAGGGSAVTTSYIWCGSSPCQARDSTNAPTREYLAEGEFVPGSPGQPYYYGVDQIGSVRRVFASTSDAPAYGYDPYGNALQTTAPLTDSGYAGMFYNADSGLYLTQYRVYDPVVGRWLSRDPLGEPSSPGANLYVYVNGDTINAVDPMGLFAIGLSIEATYITPTSGRGFGIAGVNLEYTSQAGLQLYYFATPASCHSSGTSVGLGVAINAATGNGAWTGPFNNILGNWGPVGGSYFSSPTGGGNWQGVSLGYYPLGLPAGVATGVTHYGTLF
jgi:RHS repeat-associated protein